MNWRADKLDDPWPRAFEWVESHLGGHIVSYRRQAHWRPAWFLDFQCESGIVSLYWRGLRLEHSNASRKLERECRILKVFEAHAIAVPHVYGYCADPGGILMERVGGKILREARIDDEERDTAIAHYMEELEKIHRIDLADFEAIGIKPPPTDEDVQLSQLEGQERVYRQFKRGPEPEIEFILRWLYRHIPRRPGVACPILWDAGQLRYGDFGLKIMDVETAQIGDPLADLASMRLRSLIGEPMGDLSKAFLHYADVAGAEIDLSALNFHTVRFGLGTPIWNAHVVTDPQPGVDLAENLNWYYASLKFCLEVIAHELGVMLEPEDLPPANPSRQATLLTSLSQLIKQLGQGDSINEFQAYQAATASRLVQSLVRIDQVGAELEARSMEDVRSLLGAQFDRWQEADSALERFVLDAPPERDEELVRFFHRRVSRQSALIGRSHLVEVPDLQLRRH
jgi:tRNA A-37 threonylcarbamoyl transferase component Bud32